MLLFIFKACPKGYVHCSLTPPLNTDKVMQWTIQQPAALTSYKHLGVWLCSNRTKYKLSWCTSNQKVLIEFFMTIQFAWCYISWGASCNCSECMWKCLWLWQLSVWPFQNCHCSMCLCNSYQYTNRSMLTSTLSAWPPILTICYGNWMVREMSISRMYNLTCHFFTPV